MATTAASCMARPGVPRGTGTGAAAAAVRAGGGSRNPPVAGTADADSGSGATRSGGHSRPLIVLLTGFAQQGHPGTTRAATGSKGAAATRSRVPTTTAATTGHR